MKKIKAIFITCTIMLVGTMGVNAALAGVVNYGKLTFDKQETFTFSAKTTPGATTVCKAENLTSGRVILIVPYQSTMILTPETSMGTFKVPDQGYFYAKYTQKKPSTPLSALNPMTLVKVTTAPFTSGNKAPGEVSNVSLICQTTK